MNKPEIRKNQVLDDGFHPAANFYASDRLLREYLSNKLSKDALLYMVDKLSYQGAEAAGRMNAFSREADRHPPELIKRDAWGETIDEIRFHPSYWQLMEIAVESEMMRVKWEPSLRNRFTAERHIMGFSTGFLYAMSESGQYCPLCMTDGVARLIDLFCTEEDKKRLLPHIYTKVPADFYTGAMFLTEKSGGSDVGANLVEAVHREGTSYELFGEKWFCSNVNADIIFVLARTDTNIPGTKGLSIFLVEKYLPSGGRNPLDIIRLKDKLGVRSMASGECVLNGTRATLVGKEFEGFKIMAEMMNLSRIYNSVAAVSAGRRALIEAYQFLRHRVSFGQAAVGHSLVRMKLEELSARYTACFYMTWRAIEAMDRSENGNKPEMELLRLLTPMVKKFTAESGVYLVRECMELMGGIGYIEDQVMPRIMRDVMVLPIWEGAGNIMVLDMLRALGKSEGFALLCAEVTEVAQGNTDFGTGLLKEMEEIIVLKDALNGLERATLEASAGRFFERLTNLYRDTLLLKALRPETAQWIRPSLSYFRSRQMATGTINPLSVEEINGMIAWG